MSKTLLGMGLLTLAFLSCSRGSPDSTMLSDPEKRAIEAARKAVGQFDDWADRAEFRVTRRNSQWHVTAWRVEHPEAKGNLRYAPWGRREIIVDDAWKVVDYRTGK